MAHLTQELTGAPLGRLTASLRRAYADEWFAHYNYHFAANTIKGPSSPALIERLRRKADRALEHAHLLAARLRQLGSEPVPKLTELAAHATNKPFKLPKDVRDQDGLLRAVLDAERTSLRTYEQILNQVKGRDAVTERLATLFLGEAMDGEDEFERLLGRPAPEMTGR